MGKDYNCDLCGFQECALYRRELEDIKYRPDFDMWLCEDCTKKLMWLCEDCAKKMIGEHLLNKLYESEVRRNKKILTQIP